jgi:hypothetical protein
VEIILDLAGAAAGLKEETRAGCVAANRSSVSADSLESGGAAAESSGSAEKWEESERLDELNLPLFLDIDSHSVRPFDPYK